MLNKELSELLKKARSSLNELLAVEPDSHHQLLLELYHDVELGLKDASEYPTSRHLFWDTPKSELEEKCLNDAVIVFQFVRSLATNAN
ncbi:hypothetical protein [Arsukibacterium sp.]|uniref:hypothetical protein n=1 Tax=Arsukibacterium sp. TaxID=1977258 RepID=UPI002FDB49E2